MAVPRERRAWAASPADRVVIVGVTAATVLKLWFAATTFGTNDVHSWTAFAVGVETFGPIGIYGNPFPTQYNHGPLAGWWLMSVNAMADLGLSLPFLFRLPASLSDVVTSWLVYRLVGERASAKAAATTAVAVCASPVLVIVSGFHGNTDPVFVALMFASFWLLTRSGKPLWAGICFGLAISVKLVPVVALPWLLYLAARASLRSLTRFGLGGSLVFAVLWLPVILRRWAEFNANVLGYPGNWLREWGIAEMVERSGYPAAELWLADHGRWAVAGAALLPFLLARRRGDGGAAGFGLSLIAMLLLSPAFSMQYLAWGVAAAYLLHLGAGWAYNVAASAFVVDVYSYWSSAPPWRWEEAVAAVFTPLQRTLMFATWLSVVMLVGTAVARARDANGRGTGLRTGREPDLLAAPSASRRVDRFIGKVET